MASKQLLLTSFITPISTKEKDLCHKGCLNGYAMKMQTKSKKFL